MSIAGRYNEIKDLVTAKQYEAWCEALSEPALTHYGEMSKLEFLVIVPDLVKNYAHSWSGLTNALNKMHLSKSMIKAVYEENPLLKRIKSP